MIKKIPDSIKKTLEALEKNGFEAFVVGGSVRDLLLDREPRDWDITTNALPEEILKIFPESFYENTFGTVGVKVPRFLKTTPLTKEEDILEVTTYRTEARYEDKRRPSEVHFAQRLEEDLARRDFTINALAYGLREGKWQIIDPFGGEEDIKSRVIRTVGKPEERFEEDALRLMRTVRLWSELSTKSHPWKIEEETFQALQKKARNLEQISQERIRDELSKIILSDRAAEGVDLLQKTGLLSFVIPELIEGVDVTQNLHHIYTVYEHNVRALGTVPSNKLSVRLAALLHDVGKPETKRGEGKYATFYNHDHVGARMTEKILTRLRFPAAVVRHATLLVDNHLFYYNVGEVTEASVRRLIKRVGLENMDDLMAVRIGDRLGSGVPKAKPYKLRHLEYMIEKVSQDPLSVKKLAINGRDLMQELELSAGPKVGAVLEVLLAAVIEDPSRNTREELLKRGRELAKSDLETLRKQARETIEEKKEAEDKKIKKRHWVE